MNPEFQPGEQLLLQTRSAAPPKVVRYIGSPFNNSPNALVEVRTANGYVIEVSPYRLLRITNNLRRTLGNKALGGRRSRRNRKNCRSTRRSRRR